jgi:uncharacterized protein (DUF305 family)
MNRFIVASAVSILMIGGAVAQQAAPMSGMDMKGMMDMKMMMPNPADTAATAGYKAAMMKMMMPTTPYTGDADVDFMTQMKPHHQAAIDMAMVQLANGKDPETKALAQAIITAQEKEIAMIDAWLKKKKS